MALPSVPHLLILEPDARGHAREWLGHLIEGAREMAPSSPLRLSLAVPEPLARELMTTLPEAVRQRVGLIPLDERDTALCLDKRLWLSGMARWWIMRRCLETANATHGLFLGLDHASLPLALGLRAKGRPISGILFRPSVHYGHIGPYRPCLGERLRDLRKAVLYRLMLRNPAVNAVLSLDPYFVDYARVHYAHAEKVVDTPDPVCPAPTPAASDTTLARSVPEERKLLLLFGELTPRKGILTLLQSLKQLPRDAAQRIAIMAAGAIDPPIRTAVQDAVAELHRTRPELWLHLEDRRLATGEIAALVQRSALILAPYQRFVGSSGILLWAAQAGRPVLCQDYGLMGRLAREYRLGITVDSDDPRALAESIAAFARNRATKASKQAMSRLCRKRSPAQFARIVLGQAIGDGHDAGSGRSFGWTPGGALE